MHTNKKLKYAEHLSIWLKMIDVFLRTWKTTIARNYIQTGGCCPSLTASLFRQKSTRKSQARKSKALFCSVFARNHFLDYRWKSPFGFPIHLRGAYDRVWWIQALCFWGMTAISLSGLTSYSANRGFFSLAWLFYEVVRVACLSRSWFDTRTTS